MPIPNMLPVCIPSRGRVGKLKTLSALPPSVLKHTTLLVPTAELPEYRDAYGYCVKVVASPDGIGPTRQYAFKEAAMAGRRGFIMIDDDLTFSTRKQYGERIAYERATPKEVGQSIAWICRKIQGGYGWAGLSNRFMAVHKADEYESSNPSMIWGVSMVCMQAAGVKFTDVEVCEDWHVCLSLLEWGFPNVYSARWVVSGSAQNKNGGCAAYRDTEMVRRSQEKFVSLHPRNSKLVPTESLQQGCPVGVGLRVSWKKAFENSWVDD